MENAIILRALYSRLSLLPIETVCGAVDEPSLAARMLVIVLFAETRASTHFGHAQKGI